MLLELIANAAPVQPVDHDFMGKLVAGLIALGALGGVFGFQLGRRKVSLEPQPLAVKMEDHFVTRREFDSFKGEITADIKEIKGLFRETVALIRQQQENLTKDIRDMGTGAYNGRQKIWDKVNDQGERLKSVEDRIPLIKKTGA